jgi:hypothetical protein
MHFRPHLLPAALLLIAVQFSITATSRAQEIKEPAPARFTCIDLQKHANQPLDRDFHGYEGNNLKPLPRGRKTLGEVDFAIGEKFIQLASKRAPDWPEEVENIAVGTRAAQLHLLHGTGWTAAEGEEIAHVTVHYEDQTTERIPIEYGPDVQDWWDYGSDRPPQRAVEVWRDVNDASQDFRGRRIEIRLFNLSWTNPHPEKTIARVDYVSKNESASAPFLIAVTADSEPAKAEPSADPLLRRDCGDDAGFVSLVDPETEQEQEAIEFLRQVGAFLEIDAQGHAVEVSLSGPGLKSEFNRGSDAVVGLLTRLPRLERAYLNSSAITDEGMQSLKEVRSVGWLSLNLTSITDAGLKELAGMVQLERLRLHGTRITNDGLQHLHDMTRLRVLDLSSTQVTDAGLPALYHLKDLELLDLRKTSITDEGARQLREALPNVTIKR